MLTAMKNIMKTATRTTLDWMARLGELRVLSFADVTSVAEARARAFPIIECATPAHGARL
jgi:hypothetical protein